jgi:uncharacterized membrane protein
MKTKLIGTIKAQPRLVTSVLVGCLLWFALPGRPSTRALMAWDCSTGLYLVLALTMMAGSTVDRIRDRAAIQDEGQMVILGLTTATALVSLAGVMVELSRAKSLKGQSGLDQVALAAITVLLSWSFLHTMFAAHYAHEYYSPDEDGTAEGLEFPGHEPPDYWDFMYFSFVIGTACATADVNVTGKRLRRLTMLHCIVAFFFNTTILALSVNIGAGFF